MTSALITQITEIQRSLPPTVRLIAVSKQVSVEKIRQAYQAGIRDFGESRIQEAALKQTQLQDLPDLTWHLIGHLQTNKAQKALELFDWIHAVDSLKLAEKLNELAAKSGRSPQVLLQVKLRPDPNKYGFTPEELWSALPQLNQCSSLQIQGLMSIPPLGLTPNEQLEFFQATATLAEQIKQQPYPYLQMQHLSMGMSQDYPLAIQAGATLIRLGTILFGDRPQPTLTSTPVTHS